MKKRKNFRKRKPKDNSIGLQVKVFNNNVDGALKVLKRKVKNDNLMFELKKRTFYRKPSEIKREKKNLAILRSQYQDKKS